MKWVDVCARAGSFLSATPDDGCDKVTHEAFSQVQRFTLLAYECLPDPMRVLPTGIGGIVIESRDGNVFRAFEARPDGICEVRVFVGGRLVRRIEGQGVDWAVRAFGEKVNAALSGDCVGYAGPVAGGEVQS